MSAIALALPPDVQAATDGIEAFARAEILPLHDANRALLENPRLAWRDDGRHADAVVALIDQVRQRAAAAGFGPGIVAEDLPDLFRAERHG